MKPHFALPLFALISGIFIFSGCEKRAIDFRNKYTGDYNVVYAYDYWQMNQGVTESDTVTVTASVLYDKKGPRDEIKIHLLNQDLKFEIDKSGDVMLCDVVIGKFKDKDHFSLIYSSNTCPGGGMGGGAHYKIDGTKK